MKDHDLDKFLEALRVSAPSQMEVARWKSRVQAEIGRAPRQNKEWLQLVAAALVGLLIGAGLFGQFDQTEEKNLAENATIEFVVTKLN